MDEVLKTIRNTNQICIPLFRKHWLELLAIFTFCETFDQFFKHLNFITAQYGEQNMAAVFGRLTVSLLSLVLLTHWAPLRVLGHLGQLPQESLVSFAMRHVRDFTLESLRALGVVLLFLLLFILPGLWKYVQYLLVPYVVLADPNYKAGQVDALKESKRLMQGYSLLGTFVLIVSLPVVLQVGQLTEPLRFTESPLESIISFTALSLLSFYLNLLLFEFYRVRKATLGRG